METIIKLLKSITTWVILGVVASGVLLYFSCENVSNEKEVLGFCIGQTQLDVENGDDFLMVNYVLSPMKGMAYMLPTVIAPANESAKAVSNCMCSFFPSKSLTLAGVELPMLVKEDGNVFKPVTDGAGYFIESMSAKSTYSYVNSEGVKMLGFGFDDIPVRMDTYKVSVSADDSKATTINVINVTVYCMTDDGDIEDTLKKGTTVAKFFLKKTKTKYNKKQSASIVYNIDGAEPTEIEGVYFYSYAPMFNTLQMGLSL